ncbi:MAG: dihydroorotate dehydrogenase [Candidatus Bathyarchaeia archaeon]
MRPDLSVELAGLRLRNPLVLASGIWGISAKLLRRAASAGAGAVVTKSLGLTAREGYRNPTVVRLPVGFLNAMGLPNPGVEAFRVELEELRDLEVPVIASIYGFSTVELVEVARRLHGTPIAAVEVNLSCPHVGSIHEAGSDPQLVREMVAGVVEASRRDRKPVFAKLSPNATDPVLIAKAAVDAGASVLTAINTVKAMAIDVETGRPILSNRTGGLSGPAIKPIALRHVYELSKAVKVPIIGCGGVETYQDALEFLMAGATAVAIGSAVGTKGIGVFREIAEGIEAYMARKGFDAMRQLVGLSHEY